MNEVSPSRNVPEFKEVLQTLDDGRPVPPPSRLNPYKQHAKSFEDKKKIEHARDIMSSPVKLISHSSKAEEAKVLMEKHGFRHLPVVNEVNVIIGMISDRELLGQIENKLCQDIMIQKLIVCEEHTSINEIAIILLREKINALPIVNRKKEVAGIITLSDIFAYVIKSTPFLGSA